MVDSWQEFEPAVIDLFELGIKRRLAPGETFEDAMQLSFALGRERANRFNRPVTAVDVELVAAGLCWWPLKPAPTQAHEQQAQQARAELLDRNRQPDYLVDQPIGPLSESGEQLVTVLLSAPSDDLIEFLIRRGEATGPLPA